VECYRDGMTAITVRLTAEDHEWLRERSFRARIPQAGIIAAALDVARRGEASVIRRAERALRQTFGDTGLFSQEDAASVIDLDWLGDRPALWAELQALGLIERARVPLWRMTDWTA
jgi:hypothetical protein